MPSACYTTSYLIKIKGFKTEYLQSTQFLCVLNQQPYTES